MIKFQIFSVKTFLWVLWVLCLLAWKRNEYFLYLLTSFVNLIFAYLFFKILFFIFFLFFEREKKMKRYGRIKMRFLWTIQFRPTPLEFDRNRLTSSRQVSRSPNSLAWSNSIRFSWNSTPLADCLSLINCPFQPMITASYSEYASPSNYPHDLIFQRKIYQWPFSHLINCLSMLVA